MNSVTLVGRLTKNPELRYMPDSGTAVTKFVIAIDRDYTKKDGTRDTDFIPVEVIGKIAESCVNYLEKGRLVALQGNIRVDRYETQSGEKRTFTKVNARQVQFLESNNKSNQGNNQSDNNLFEPGKDLNTNEWQAIDDSEIPF